MAGLYLGSFSVISEVSATKIDRVGCSVRLTCRYTHARVTCLSLLWLSFRCGNSCSTALVTSTRRDRTKVQELSTQLSHIVVLCSPSTLRPVDGIVHQIPKKSRPRWEQISTARLARSILALNGLDTGVRSGRCNIMRPTPQDASFFFPMTFSQAFRTLSTP